MPVVFLLSVAVLLANVECYMESSYVCFLHHQNYSL